MSETTEQVINEPQQEKKKVPNPTGRGGFQDHPELINAGGRPKNQESFAYWMNQFKNMNMIEFKDWVKNNPEETRSMAASMAYERMRKATTDLDEFKEVADRTEGRSKQTIDMNAKVITKVKVEIVENESAD